MNDEEKTGMETPDIETPNVETPDSPNIEGATKDKNVFSRKIDNMKSRVKNDIDVKKQTFEKSSLGQFGKGISEARKAEGFGNKMKALGKGTLNGAKASKAGQKFKKIQEKMKKMAQTIQKFLPIIQYVAIAVGVIVAVFNVAVFIYSFAQSFSSSPHYYCDINPSQEVRQSALYKQYCTNAIREVDENGIPIVPFMMQAKNGWMNPDTETWEHDYSKSFWPGTTSMMGDDSCGPSAACMILSYYTGQMFFPDSTEFVSNANRFKGYGVPYGPGGTAFNVQKIMADIVSETTGINITVEARSKFSIEELDKVLAAGDMVVLCMGSNTDSSINGDGNQWTTGGHYIAVIGKLPDGTYAVNESGGTGCRSYWGTDYWSLGLKHSVSASALENCVSTDYWNVFHAPENS